MALKLDFIPSQTSPNCPRSVNSCRSRNTVVCQCPAPKRRLKSECNRQFKGSRVVSKSIASRSRKVARRTGASTQRRHETNVSGGRQNHQRDHLSLDNWLLVKPDKQTELNLKSKTQAVTKVATTALYSYSRTRRAIAKASASRTLGIVTRSKTCWKNPVTIARIASFRVKPRHWA